MDTMVSSRSYPPRFGNTTLKDLNREVDQIRIDLSNVERWRDRFYEAIHQGFVMDRRGNRIELTETNGIDILGNMMEASDLSPNKELYGDLHNVGHLLIAYSHDPDHRYLESAGVIGDSSTAMRDPAFYRWHAFVDDVFQEHKGSLPRYPVARLNYENVLLTGVDVQVDGGQPNRLQTFWQQSDVDLSRGMDFTPRGNVFARFTHIQHSPFTYNIQVNNTGAARQGTCRIYIAPKNDERGLPMLFRDQRTLFIELDRFVVNLKPGANTINRKSTDSSVSIPFERTFRNLETNRPPDSPDTTNEFNFCGCGWPQHMLIPKGTPEGMPCQLFVMVSNYTDDKVEQDVAGLCTDSSSYCGIRNKLYPDKRSMGYPFDRLPRDGVDTLVQFVTPNMLVKEVVIQFTDRTVLRKN